MFHLSVVRLALSSQSSNSYGTSRPGLCYIPMKDDPDLGLRRCMAEELAQAHLNVTACQERAAQSADQLVDARVAMAQSLQRLDEAKETLQRISMVSWLQLNGDV